MSKILEYFSWIESVTTLIWVLLTVILAWILAKIYFQTGTQNRYFGIGILLILLIWMFPLYNSHFHNPGIGEIGNVITLMVTVFYKIKLSKYSLQLSKLLIPQLLWLCIAILYHGLLWIDKFLIG